MEFPKKILMVDDDPTVATVLENQLQPYGVQLAKAANLDTALYLFNTQRFELVLVELEFEPLSGLALVQKWRQHEIEDKRLTPIIVMTGLQRDAFDENLLKEIGDVEAIMKPFTAVQLHPVVQRALQRHTESAKYEEVHKMAVKMIGPGRDASKAIAYVTKNLEGTGVRGKRMLGDLYEAGEQYDDGLKVVSQLLQQTPEDISLLNSKGRLLLKLGRFQEAAQHMEKADQMAPGNIERINQMALMYLKMNDPQMSVKKMKDLIKLNPENPDLKFDMFTKLHEHGFDKEAQAFCKETTGPQEVVKHYNNKGVALSKTNNTEAALTEYERALQYFPTYKENYRIYFNIALAHVAQKTQAGLELAQEALKKCLELNPGFEKGVKTLEAVEKNLEKFKK